jgi:hypothetical protein
MAYMHQLATTSSRIPFLLIKQKEHQLAFTAARVNLQEFNYLKNSMK